MSVRTSRRSLALGVIAVAIALLTACDAAGTSPTAPSSAGLEPASGPLARMDTLGCLRGWVVVNGVVVCN